MKEAIGSLQCQGLEGAFKSAYKAIDEVYNQGKTILLLDADGAFNHLNRTITLITAARTIHDAYQVLHNVYQCPTRAFNNGKEVSVESKGVSYQQAFTISEYLLWLLK